MTQVNNDFVQNEAELLAEHEAEKAKTKALEDAKEEAERKARWEQEAKERREQNIQKSSHLRAIVKCIDRKHVCQIDEPSFKLHIDGVDVSYAYDFERIWSRGGRWGYGSRATGKMKFVIRLDGYGRSRETYTFPQHKDGSFNYSGIASHLVDYANRRNVKRRLDQQQARNKSEAEAAAAEIFKGQDAIYQDVINPSSSAEKPVFFKLKIEGAMTKEQAVKLAKALRSCGVKLHYSDKI